MRAQRPWILPLVSALMLSACIPAPSGPQSVPQQPVARPTPLPAKLTTWERQTVNATANANGIFPPYLIRPGQQLAIPADRYHEVRRGKIGQVDRPWLHCEIRRNRQPVDPAQHLPDLG